MIMTKRAKIVASCETCPHVFYGYRALESAHYQKGCVHLRMLLNFIPRLIGTAYFLRTALTLGLGYLLATFKEVLQL
jgi:hypothetical protein